MDETQAAAVSWLWEDRPGELVSPGPLYQKPRGTCRPSPAWEEYSKIGIGPTDTDGASAAASHVTTRAGDVPLRRGSGRRQRGGTPNPMSRRESPFCESPDTLASHLGKRNGRARPASALTMAHTGLSTVVPGSTAMWRGNELPLWMADRQWQMEELAKHRRDCKLHQAVRDRVKSKQHREHVQWSRPPSCLKMEEEDVESNSRKTTKVSFHASDDEDEPVIRSRSSSTVVVPEPVQHQPAVRKINSSESPTATGSDFSKARLQLHTAVQMAALPIRHHMTDSPNHRPGTGGYNRSKSKDLVDMEKAMFARQDSMRTQVPSKTDDAMVRKTSSAASAASKKSGSPTGFRRQQTPLLVVDDDGGTPTRKLVSTPRPNVERSDSLRGRSSYIMKSRMRGLLERRKMEFTQWPLDEQARLRNAFQAGVDANSSVLDARGLRRAFAALGLEGRTPQEKDAMGTVAREAFIRGNINFFDFVFQLVPEVEHKLEEQRSPKLYAEFQKIDDKGTGRIKEHQCLAALKLHTQAAHPVAAADDDTFQSFWKMFAKDFPEMYKGRCQGSEQWLDFKGFQVLATQLDSQRTEFQRRIEKLVATNASLPPHVEALHVGELTCLKRIFDAQDTSDAGCVSARGLAIGTLHCGVAAPVGPLWDRMQQAMQAMNEYEGNVFTFKDFLSLIDGMREETRMMLKGAIQNYFKNFVWTGPPSVPLGDVASLMNELMVCKDCCTNFEDLLGFVAACDKDEGADLDTASVVVLIAKVCEKSRMAQRENEASLAHHLGFSTKQVFQLRETFATLSRTGFVGPAELKLWFKEINPEMEPTIRELEALIEEVAPIAPPLIAKREFGSACSPDQGIHEHASGDHAEGLGVDAENLGHIADALASHSLHQPHMRCPKTDAIVKKGKDVAGGGESRRSSKHKVQSRSASRSYSEGSESEHANENQAAPDQSSHLAVPIGKTESRTSAKRSSDGHQSSVASSGVVMQRMRSEPKAQAEQEHRAAEQVEQDKDKQEKDKQDKDKQQDGALPEDEASMASGSVLYFDGFMRLVSMMMHA